MSGYIPEGGVWKAAERRQRDPAEMNGWCDDLRSADRTVSALLLALEDVLLRPDDGAAVKAAAELVQAVRS